MLKLHKNQNKVVVGGSLLFILLNAIGIINEFYLLNALPFILLVAYLAFFRLDLLYYFVIFCVPFSISLEKLDIGGLGIILPTEPILAGLLLLFVFKLLREGFDRRFLTHPMSLVIYAQLVWILITSFTSELPLVSIKFLTSRLWFIASFYFIASRIINKPDQIKKFFWIYIIPLGCVVLYTIVHHSMYAFEEKPGHWVMSPFFKDHTSYGAILAMVYPFLVWQSFKKSNEGILRVVFLSILAFFTLAIILSYTRAAWVSLVGAFMVFLVFKFKVKSWVIWSGVATVGVLIIIFQTTLSQKLSKNQQDSSSNLQEHVQSISNVSSDASNLERLNRWNSAFKMFFEKPILGHGPGTYAFLYAPYQNSRDKTIISTNAGDMGNAHSEYFGPLAEMGAVGMLLMIILVIVVVKIGYRLNKNLINPEHRGLFMSVYFGLLTYLVHGALNNYLDTDKASSLFWGFIAIMVLMDLNTKKLNESAA